MTRFNTQGIILSRTNYGEADRILTILTPNHGKVKAIAKGVRKAKAKLAGSIELFSLLDVTVLPGRGEIDTLLTARLVKHYGNIVKDTERTKLAYELLKLIDKNTPEHPEPEYFSVLDAALASLNEKELEPQLTELWFKLQLLKLSGQAPNLTHDTNGEKLKENVRYNFDIQKMAFVENSKGYYGTNEIKVFRLMITSSGPGFWLRFQNIPILLMKNCQRFLAGFDDF